MVLRVPGSGREVFAELKNRGVEDVFVAVCDGMKGLLEVISTTWEKTVVQQCIAHPDPQQLPLRRPAASGCDRSLAQTGLHGPVRGRDEGPFRRVRGRVGNRYPAIIQLWKSSWAELVPFLEYDPEIHRVTRTTNAIESDQHPLPPRGPDTRTLPN